MGDDNKYRPDYKNDITEGESFMIGIQRVIFSEQFFQVEINGNKEYDGHLIADEGINPGHPTAQGVSVAIKKPYIAVWNEKKGCTQLEGKKNTAFSGAQTGEKYG